MIRASRRRGRARKSAHPQRLKITSMMDILTVLLLFLLKSFVVDAEVVAPPPDVTLPNSTSDESQEESLVIAVSAEAISLGGEPITTVRDAMRGSGLLIEPLQAQLDVAYRQMESLAAKRGKSEVSGKITIQGDQDMEFQLLQRVMYTCSFVGFGDLSLAVVKES
jgi:biopolymer transport protein ExbD